MPAMRIDDRSTAYIPYLHKFIVAAGRKARAIGRPRQGCDGQVMSAIDKELAAGGRIPYLHGAIVASRRDTRAIGRPCHRLYAVPVAAISNHAKAMRVIPDTHALIIASRNDLRSPRRPGNRRHTAAMPITDEARITLRLRSAALERGRRLGWRRRPVTLRETGGQRIGLADQQLGRDSLKFLPDHS